MGVVDQDTLTDLVAALRKFGAEATSVEAKRAEKDVPKSVRETLSSFANSPGGGVIILGIDENVGYAATGVTNPSKVVADLASMARDEMSPPLSPEISLGTIDGAAVIVAEISELPRQEKPCYYKNQGLERGSYIRVGESDRRLTSEEVQQLVADRGQPLFDHEIVPDSTPDDLDPEVVVSYVTRLKRNQPRIFSGESNDVILRMTKVVAKDSEGVLRLTLGGVLAMGRYPQQFFPQLNITFVHYPTVSGEATPAGVRFLDNVSIDGSIPQVVIEALNVVHRNMSRRALIIGSGRKDVWEYPPEALREAIVNALVHRDLSPGSRGNQVQIEMYPDRLRIMNPGGLFGAIDITRLGEEGRSSARNGSLMKILEDVTVPGETRTVCENRGSGIRAMITALRHAGMSPPRFKDATTSFEVVMPNHSLLDEETIQWLHILGREGLRDTQCTALALMRKGEILDNGRYRAATGIYDSRIATFELQDLVARELVTQSGTRGGAKYSLSEYARQAGPDSRKRIRPNRRRQILDLLGLHGELSKTEISELLAINPKTAEHWLRTLKSENEIDATGGGRSSKNTRYRLTAQGRQPRLFDSDDYDRL
ncbi:ATP-binding protein [Nonomuraea fuscirosea]|uniref:ATP-binding protein n=1 Tax=Nonomuraea fuscirosea TaxID=1291556 RepID=UPI00342F9E65